MLRRLPIYALVAGLFPFQAGCQSSCSSCDQRPGLFTRMHSKSAAPCQTVGRTGGCFDATTGQPMPCPPDVPTTVIPGGAMPYPPPSVTPFPGPRPDELHMPSPSDLIRPPAVPVPAPGDASLPFPSAPGVPVKNK